MGKLPSNFHQRVIDLENEMQEKPSSEDQAIKKLSNLMGLYSTAIEYYFKTAELPKQDYYLEKLTTMQESIRRIETIWNKKPSTPKNRSTEVQN